MKTPRNKDLYRLPWSTNDNPIGWLEITDACNITCEGCYRLALGTGHKPVKQVMEEILFLKKWRNCNGISISGGEPVLHPDIMKIISFINENKMKSIMLTNGYALSDGLLKELKQAGLTGLSFHIDTTQIRPELGNRKIKDEIELNEIRVKYARMVGNVGLYAHFGITVTHDNLQEVPKFIQWAVDHMKLISGISLIIFRSLPVGKEMEYFAGNKKVDVDHNILGYALSDGEEDNKVRSRDVYSVIRESIPDFNASGYLGGTEDHTSLKWLLGNLIVDSKGKIFGAYGKRTMEIAQTFHHLINGTYLAYPKHRIGKKIFAMAVVDKPVRKALGRYLVYCLSNPLRLFNNVNTFGIGIIQPPDVLPDGRIDLCDDCPDMCIYEGRLVNSCRFDECRKFGTLLHFHLSSEKVPATVGEELKPEPNMSNI